MIMVIVDYFTKIKIIIPTNAELTAAGTAELFKTHIFKRFGLPRGVVSDRGPQFVSRFISELYKGLGIKGLPSTAYHPQTDGQTERANQEIEHFLRLYVNYEQDDWAKWLDEAEFAMNDRYHEAIKTTPFRLLYGYDPWKGDPNTLRSQNPDASEWVKTIIEKRQVAKDALVKAASDMKKFYDAHKGRSLDLSPGDHVWLEGTNLKTMRPQKKLEVKCFGPFKILEKLGTSYRLQLPRSWNRIHPVFNEVLLTKYVTPTFSGQQLPPPPDPIDVEGHPEYEVEKIVGYRKRGRGESYLVKWKGWPNEENTWEPKSNLDGAKEAISDYWRQRKE